jgi:uncharacterized protein
MTRTKRIAVVGVDTNVFVAAGFNRNSASARLIAAIRDGELQMVWSPDTRAETQAMLERIPRISWTAVADLFAAEHQEPNPAIDARFACVADPADRKFAALAAATKAILVSSDQDLLSVREQLPLQVVSPSEFWRDRAEPR